MGLLQVFAFPCASPKFVIQEKSVTMKLEGAEKEEEQFNDIADGWLTSFAVTKLFRDTVSMIKSRVRVTNFEFTVMWCYIK